MRHIWKAGPSAVLSSMRDGVSPATNKVSRSKKKFNNKKKISHEEVRPDAIVLQGKSERAG